MNHRPLSEPKLSIFGFEPSNCERTFLLSKFSPTLFDRITTQYPFINDLNLTISLQSFMDKSELINQFFRFYHDLITSLYIHVYVTNETNVDIRQYLNKTLDMLSEINFLGNLVKLVVDIEPLPETYTIEFITPIHDFQVLPQLKKLYFATPLNSFNLLNESFRTYPPTRLNNMAFGYEQSRGFVNSYPLSDNFCLMIDQLHYHTLSFQPLPMYQTISELSTRYHFLSRLTIQLDQLYPLRLINSLSRLRKLEYLSIFLSHQSGEKINFDLSSIDQAKPQMISKLVPLNHLIVRCTVSSHKSFQSVHLGWIFPNLISLEFSYDAFVCEEPSCGAKHIWCLSTVSSNIVSKESLFMNEINEKEIEKRQNSNLLMNRFMNYTDDDFLDHGYSEDCQTSTYSFNSDLTRTYCDHVSSKFDLFQHRLRTTNIMPQLSSQIIQDSISEIAFDETLNLNNEID
ncbi:hypothetical protein BLOT_011422 [Blomia tropicalis]|nr:hypothetical protein BLOT_011422 [Blomia tropicalis]